MAGNGHYAVRSTVPSFGWMEGARTTVKLSHGSCLGPRMQDLQTMNRECSPLDRTVRCSNCCDLHPWKSRMDFVSTCIRVARFLNVTAYTTGHKIYVEVAFCVSRNDVLRTEIT
jgi:hypothetical protein